VHVPLSRFLKTWRGKARGLHAASLRCLASAAGSSNGITASAPPLHQVLDSENEMNATKVISVGISVAGGGALEVCACALPFVILACMLKLRHASRCSAAWAIPPGAGENTRAQHGGTGLCSAPTELIDAMVA
jgi:hypothetical protein